jgi:hypothetical protein
MRDQIDDRLSEFEDDDDLTEQMIIENLIDASK